MTALSLQVKMKIDLMERKNHSVISFGWGDQGY